MQPQCNCHLANKIWKSVCYVVNVFSTLIATGPIRLGIQMNQMLSIINHVLKCTGMTESGLILNVIRCSGQYVKYYVSITLITG